VARNSHVDLNTRILVTP